MSTTQYRGSKSKRGTHKIRNWREYNESLVKRYDITVWIKKGWIEVWEEKTPKRKRGQGAQRKYSNQAIECLLTIKYLFHLPYRGVEGLARSLFHALLKIPVTIPDYSTINRRQEGLAISLPHRAKRQAIDLVLDATGFKVFGEGEWVVRMRGGKSKQRTWRRIHIGMNPHTHMIEAVEMTENTITDAQGADALLKSVRAPISRLIADGAYDKQKVYDALMIKGTKEILIPPQWNARLKDPSSKDPPHPRDMHIRRIQVVGKTQWKKEVGYHRRSLVETTMYRMKRIFGDRLSDKTVPHQKVEVAVKCKILNMMTHMGMPDSYFVPPH